MLVREYVTVWNETRTNMLSMSVPPFEADRVDRVRWSWARALGAGAGSVLLVAVPTDLIDTTWFSRMSPTGWWEYVLAAATVTLVLVSAGLGVRRGASRCSAGREPLRVGSAPWMGAGAVALAVGCPLCNKIAVAALGAGGALELWAPAQPAVGGAAVLSLGFAVVLRWRLATDGADEPGYRRIVDGSGTPTPPDVLLPGLVLVPRDSPESTAGERPPSRG